MTNHNQTSLKEENRQMRERLDELEETLRAIRSGEVDALVISKPEGEQVYTLKGALEPYRVMVEVMSEGAVTLGQDGTILYCNSRFAELVKMPQEQIVGQRLQNWIPAADQDKFRTMLALGWGHPCREQLKLLLADQSQVLVNFSISPLPESAGKGIAAVITDLTEVAVAAEIRLQLQESQNQFKYMFDHSPVGESITSLSGELHPNQAFCDMLGYSEDELKHCKWQDVTVPDDFPLTEQALATLLSGEQESTRFVKRYRHKNGNVVWVDLSTALRRDETGKPLYFMTSRIDITANMLTKQKLQASEQQFRTLGEALPQIVWMTRADGWNIYFNQQWVDYTGLTLEESYGHGWNIPFHPDDQKRAWDAWQFATQTDSTYSLECRLRRADGIYRWWLVRGVALHDTNGKVVNWFGTFTDIEDIKQAEQQLQLAASVFTHAREGIMITTADGTIIDVNEAFNLITGYSREEVLGHNASLLKSGRQNKQFYADMWRDLIEKGQWYGEVWNRRKNGDVYAEMMTVSAIRDAQGKTQQYVALFSDITTFKEHEQQLEHIAHYDALTNLPNRVLLADRLQLAMVQAQRRGQILSVAYLDLDGFKAINDNHGHQTGDLLLVSIAGFMKQALREGDTLARIGGDEFVAVLPDLDDIEACIPMIARLLAAAAQPIPIGEKVFQVSASLGVSFYPQAEEVDADQLLRQADQAMYQAKLAGKNRYHIFDPEQDSSIRGHHDSLNRIREALVAHEFVLYYQPKVNMRSGKIVGAEALIRWQHPDKGLLPPALFLPVIEDHALSIEIGEWVIDTALAQIDSWHNAGLDIPVSVNVSARQLQCADFVERLGVALAMHPNVNPSRLELEVLETSALEDITQITRIMESCRKIGVMFALDDFGTGYSSLTYLKRLPVALLKIDQSFVRDMLNDQNDLAILDGVLSLATAFGRQVIAEGVETREHGEVLLRLGCELAQGYGIARPMPADEMPDWSASWRTEPSWIDLPLISRVDLPLLFASAKHRAWIAGLEKHLKGEEEAPPLDYHQCLLGQWLDTEGLDLYGDRSAFHSLDPLHRQVHSLAAELMELHAHNRTPEALARLDELRALRDAWLEQLKELLNENGTR
jgi:diguanylate cyclase (GGDEF)-like protein/PAS domain S-box-containing protein